MSCFKILGKLIEGGKPVARGWLTDRFGPCWQIVPRNIGELISHPKAMEVMMGMIKMDLPALEGRVVLNHLIVLFTASEK